MDLDTSHKSSKGTPLIQAWQSGEATPPLKTSSYDAESNAFPMTRLTGTCEALHNEVI
jgi:hypothetical protein